MSIRKLSEKALDTWVSTLIGMHPVFGVQAKGNRFVFDKLEKASQLRLDYDVTILPPKKYFLPQKEELLSFKNGVFESIKPDERFVLLGVHPYDLVGIRQMDKIFSQDNYDVHYMQRREQAVIIAADIQNCSENNFSGCMSTAVVQDGYDMLITRIGSDYLVEAKTAKGEELAKHMKEATDADAESLKKRTAVWEANQKNMKKHSLKPALKDIPGLLDKNMENAVWAEKAELCFSCGSCVLVCPTCYCFDVQDEVEWSLDQGKRVRKWDGCMLEKFATVAGNHNFRPDKSARYRHRYLRKGNYVAAKVGEIACVGCGRCISACVAKIANPVEIFNTLAEVK